MKMEQKAALVLVVVLGFSSVLLGMRYLGQHLRRPFFSQIYYSGDKYLSLTEKESAEREKMKKQDLDSDKLNDYDELYVYKTSPYLADSDSDSFSDYEEIVTGNDPNCPVGSVCERTFASADLGTAQNPADIISGVPLSNFDSNVAKFNTEEDILKYLESMSIEEIKKTLLEVGLPQETLDSIPDEELRDLFNEALANASTTNAFADLVREKALQANEEPTQ